MEIDPIDLMHCNKRKTLRNQLNMTQEFKKTDLNEAANNFDLVSPATPENK
jgi:hypothetical protein